MKNMMLCKPCHSGQSLKVVFDASAGQLVGNQEEQDLSPPPGTCRVTGAHRTVPVCPFALLLWSKVEFFFFISLNMDHSLILKVFI